MMLKTELGKAGCLSVILLSLLNAAAIASDWVEEPARAYRTQQPANDMPPTAPTRELKSAQQGFLTGSASMVGTGAPPRMYMPLPLASQSAAPLKGYAAEAADANRFMLNAKTDNVVPPSSLAGWLQRTHPEFNLQAQSNPDAVVEVKGAWDNSSEILKAMGIRFHAIKAKELRDFSLANTKVLVINCEGKIPAEAVEPIRQWVIHGGALISTDWTLGTFVERAFPGMVAWDGYHTKGTTVDAVLLPTDPTLLAGTQVPRATWKLDEESQALRVLRPSAVRVLARSYRLADQDPNSSRVADYNQRGVLACEFNYGRGSVLHLVGHFDYNAGLGFMRYLLPDAIPGAGIGLRQAIATNFLIRALQGSGNNNREVPTL
jgi:hypothetical protein